MQYENELGKQICASIENALKDQFKTKIEYREGLDNAEFENMLKNKQEIFGIVSLDNISPYEMTFNNINLVHNYKLFFTTKYGISNIVYNIMYFWINARRLSFEIMFNAVSAQPINGEFESYCIMNFSIVNIDLEKINIKFIKG